MSRGKNFYFGFLLLSIFVVSTTYFSYAFFISKNEEHGKLNIVAGTLDYKIESDDLENSSVTVDANTIKKIDLKITSLNEIDSKYELYYFLNKDIEEVEVGYSTYTSDMPSGTIPSNGNKMITVGIKNNSNQSVTVYFGVEGGFSNQVLTLKEGNSLDLLKNICEYDIGKTFTFSYTGDAQVFSTPCEGNYQVELWGAQGGSISGVAYNADSSLRADNLIYSGGKGAYTTGNIILKENLQIYIYVGSSPSMDNISLSGGTYEGGYNGGASIVSGQEQFGSPGGGATDIRLVSGLWDDFESLKSRIMVAAGGGGANFRNQGFGEGNGGEGGTLIGNSGYEALVLGSYFRDDYSYGYSIGQGATQTSGGNVIVYQLDGTVLEKEDNGTFGGANFIPSTDNNAQTGGGGGYYSGGTSLHGGAGGGSSFISGYDGCNAIDRSSMENNIIHTGQSEHYSGYVFTNSSMIAGDSEMPTHDATSTMTGNSGNGYAKITYLGD